MLRLAAAGEASYLGVNVIEIDKDRARALALKDEHGVEITTLEDDGPAAKGGLKKGDVVLEYNGQRVEGTQQFVRLVRETPPNRDIKLLVSRNGATQTMVVTTGTRKNVLLRNGDHTWTFPGLEGREFRMPDVPQVFVSIRSGALGIQAEPVDSQLAQFFGVKQGVLVRSVTANSAAEKAGLKAGDVITRMDGKDVASPGEITSAIRGAAPKKSFALTLFREKKEMNVTVTLDENAGPKPRPAPATTIRNRNIL